VIFRELKPLKFTLIFVLFQVFGQVFLNVEIIPVVNTTKSVMLPPKTTAVTVPISFP
jgi:hypothetical protein